MLVSRNLVIGSAALAMASLACADEINPQIDTDHAPWNPIHVTTNTHDVLNLDGTFDFDGLPNADAPDADAIGTDATSMDAASPEVDQWLNDITPLSSNEGRRGHVEPQQTIVPLPAPIAIAGLGLLAVVGLRRKLA